MDFKCPGPSSPLLFTGYPTHSATTMAGSAYKIIARGKLLSKCGLTSAWHTPQAWNCRNGVFLWAAGPTSPHSPSRVPSTPHGVACRLGRRREDPGRTMFGWEISHIHGWAFLEMRLPLIAKVLLGTACELFPLWPKHHYNPFLSHHTYHQVWKLISSPLNS